MYSIVVPVISYFRVLAVKLCHMSENKLRILHEWPFHMEFIKRAFGEFDKFHMK